MFVNTILICFELCIKYGHVRLSSCLCCVLSCCSLGRTGGFLCSMQVNSWRLTLKFRAYRWQPATRRWNCRCVSFQCRIQTSHSDWLSEVGFQSYECSMGWHSNHPDTARLEKGDLDCTGACISTWICFTTDASVVATWDWDKSETCLIGVHLSEKWTFHKANVEIWKNGKERVQYEKLAARLNVKKHCSVQTEGRQSASE